VPEIRKRPRLDPFWGLLLLVPPLLLLPRLGDAWLWQDEAETALLARSIVEHGVPRARTGDRLISDQPGAIDVSDDGLWIWSPWLPHYLTAGSFALLGESTASARLPFVLLGWATLGLAYALFLRWTGARELACLGVILLALSVPFLLLARQCRYYTLLSFLNLAFLYACAGAPGRRATAGMLLAGAGMAYTFPPQLATSALGAAAHAWLVKGDGVRLRGIALASGGAVLLALPFLVYAEFWSRDYRGVGYGFDSWLRYGATLRAHLVQVHLYAWPFLLALPAVFLSWGRGTPHGRRAAWVAASVAGAWLLAVAARPSALSIAAVVALSAAGTVAAIAAALRLARRGSRAADWSALVGLQLSAVFLFSGLAPFPFFRYMAGLLPLFALATAATLLHLARGRRGWAWALAGTLVACDAVQVAPFLVGNAAVGVLGIADPDPARAPTERLDRSAYFILSIGRVLLRQSLDEPPVRSLAWGYAGELRSDLVGPIESVVGYLDAHAGPDDVVFATYEHLPLLFYTDLRIVHADGANPDEPLPDWVFVHGNTRRLIPGLARALGSEYVRVPLRARETPWENIPEPYWHWFRTKERGPGLQLYRLRSPTSLEGSRSGRFEMAAEP
jgi:hypothetical protein